MDVSVAMPLQLAFMGLGFSLGLGAFEFSDRKRSWSTGERTGVQPSTQDGSRRHRAGGLSCREES